MNAELFKQAMGTRDYDYLEINNKWSRCAVEYEEDDNIYTAHCDGVLLGTYATIEAAFVRALEELAKFQKGRMD